MSNPGAFNELMTILSFLGVEEALKRLEGVKGPERRLVAQAAERAERQGAAEDSREGWFSEAKMPEKPMSAFAGEMNPITAWVCYEVFVRKHCGTGWLRAQMAKLESENRELRGRADTLRELVDLKDLRIKIEGPREAWPDQNTFEAAVADYYARKAVAWAAARSALYPDAPVVAPATLEPESTSDVVAG